MRIRKHARFSAPSLSPPSSTAPNSPDTHICELNRSPWDVLAFTQEFQYQVKIEDEYTCNGAGREPSYASNSMLSKEEVEEEDCDEMEKRFLVGCVKKKGRKKIGGKKEFDYIRCGKIDGKGWQCKKEAKQGELLCEHHLLQLESYKHKYNYSYTSRKAKAVSCKTKTMVATNKKRNKGRISSASPADFYFYSGFGPSWGKNRAGGIDAKEEKGVNDAADQTSSSSAIHISDDHDQASHDNVDLIVDDFFYDDDDDENEDDEENGGEKRIRRPVKARSLKSLF